MISRISSIWCTRQPMVNDTSRKNVHSRISMPRTLERQPLQLTLIRTISEPSMKRPSNNSIWRKPREWRPHPIPTTQCSITFDSDAGTCTFCMCLFNSSPSEGTSVKNTHLVFSTTSINRRRFHYGHLFRYPLTPIQSASVLLLQTGACFPITLRWGRRDRSVQPVTLN